MLKYRILIGIAFSLSVVVACFENPPTNLLPSPGLPQLILDGPEELVFSAHQFCWDYIPEVNINYRRENGQIRLFISSGLSYLLTGNDFSNLRPNKTNGDCAVSSFGYGGNDWYRTYGGLAQTARSANGQFDIGFFHAENVVNCTTGKNSYLSIGRVTSNDNAETWQNPQQIITSARTREPCPSTAFHGAGDPSVVLSEDGQYWLMYYNEWIEGQSGLRLARASVQSDGANGSWFKYFNGAFGQPGLGGQSTPVIPRGAAQWIGIPSVSFNVSAQNYMAVMIGPDGFYYSFSKDGIRWSESAALWTGILGKPNGFELSSNQNYYFYPSVLSLEQDTEDRTGNAPHLYLFYAKGTGGSERQATWRRRLKVIP